jgi:hypothetical protein
MTVRIENLEPSPIMHRVANEAQAPMLARTRRRRYLPAQQGDKLSPLSHL